MVLPTAVAGMGSVPRRHHVFVVCFCRTHGHNKA